MGTIKTQKIVASLIMVTFIFSSIVAPMHQVFSAGPYEPDPNFDASDYQIKNSQSPTSTASADSTSTYLSDTGSYNLNISNISEAIPAIVGCTGIVNRVQTGLTSLLNPGNTNTPAVLTSAQAAKELAMMEGTEVLQDAVSTNDSGVKKYTSETAEKAKEINDKQAQEKLREECLNGVAYSLAKGQLAKMTQITVNWINSGFDGEPLYIRDRESYFQSIADGQLLSLVGPLASVQNQYIYPFGRSVAKSIINSTKSTFENRAQSTLQNSLRDGATTQDFANDFSTGGWDGWFSLTQNDQNNPLGFGIMTSQELADRINKKQESATAELLEGKGFLSQKKCVEYATNKRADGKNAPDPKDEGTLGRECIRYETVTPGSLIQEQASSSLTSSTRQLELADSLNESLSAVFQALVNQMISQGLNSLSSFSAQNAPKTFGGLGSNKLYDSLGNDISNLSINGTNNKVLSVNKGRGWYNANGAFDITTDLGDIRKLGSDGKYYIAKKGIISLQKDYSEAVKLSLSTLPKIMPALGELDYCIPGPNPSWENSAKEAINRIIEYLQSLYFVNGEIIEPPMGLLQSGWEFNKAIQPSGGFQKIENTVGGAWDVIQKIRGKKTRAEVDQAKRDQEEARIQAEEQQFEKERATKIREAQEGFFYYKNLIDPLYGPSSPMRTPGNPWYLPMAESGIQATKYIDAYAVDIEIAKQDYKDLISQTNANVYKLNVIKGKVDKIVAAARKRRSAEMEKQGIPMIDPSCYDINPTNTLAGGGVTGQGTTTGDFSGGQNFGPKTNKPVNGSTTNEGSAGGVGGTGEIVGESGQEAVPQFSPTIKEDRSTCKATVIGVNTTTGSVTDIAWGLKLETDPNVYGQKTTNYQNTFSAYSQSGNGTLTLTVKDALGKTSSLSKSVFIPKRTVTNLGTACPQ
jgi:hypothetical protein